VKKENGDVETVEFQNEGDNGGSSRYTTVVKVGGNDLGRCSLFGWSHRGCACPQRAGPFPDHRSWRRQDHRSLSGQAWAGDTFVEGLRVTDDASLDVAEMVLSGLMNKRIVRSLVNGEIRAAGISGVDDGTIYVEKMWHPMGDLGRVGEIQDVDTHLIDTLIDADIVPVVSPISYGAYDALSYNVNADHAATAIAAKLGATKLVFVSNVPGVLVAGRVARAIDADQAERWIEEGIIFGGMIPKVRSAIRLCAMASPRLSLPISPAFRRAAERGLLGRLRIKKHFRHRFSQTEEDKAQISRRALDLQVPSGSHL
jgi:acetylglutamate kinase